MSNWPKPSSTPRDYRTGWSESCTQFRWRQIHEMPQNSDCVSGALLSLIPQWVLLEMQSWQWGKWSDLDKVTLHSSVRVNQGWPSRRALRQAPVPVPRLQPWRTTTFSYQRLSSPVRESPSRGEESSVRWVLVSAPGVRRSFESWYREKPLGGDRPHQCQGEVPGQRQKSRGRT